jgi:glycine hydroxymethyltransferase
MKEQEMRMIGNWIAAVIKDINSDMTIARVKKEVTEMAGKFPLYPE